MRQWGLALLFAISTLQVGWAHVTPIQVSVWDPVQIAPNDWDVVGLRLNLMYGKIDELYGVDMGLGVNTVTSQAWGVQMAGVANSCYMPRGDVWDAIVWLDFISAIFGEEPAYHGQAEGPMVGCQLAGVANFATDLHGIQVATLCNVAGEGTGIQFGIYDRAGDLNGLQAGLIGIADRMNGIHLCLLGAEGSASGIQMGLITTWEDDSAGIRMGLVNWGENASGIELAGWNQNKGDMKGIQLGIFNGSDDVTGGQFGLWNHADSVSGFQFGLVNWCDRMKGLQFGLVNVIESGDHEFLPLVNWGGGGGNDE